MHGCKEWLFPPEEGHGETWFPIRKDRNQVEENPERGRRLRDIPVSGRKGSTSNGQESLADRQGRGLCRGRQSLREPPFSAMHH